MDCIPPGRWVVAVLLLLLFDIGIDDILLSMLSLSLGELIWLLLLLLLLFVAEDRDGVLSGELILSLIYM